jgi:hypothetical protein
LKRCIAATLGSRGSAKRSSRSGELLPLVTLPEPKARPGSDLAAIAGGFGAPRLAVCPREDLSRRRLARRVGNLWLIVDVKVVSSRTWYAGEGDVWQ